MTETPVPPRDPVVPPRKTPSYELSHAPDGRSWTDRENLADILQRELLGPSRGDEEVIEAPPDSMYLVGRIAPVRLTGKADPAQAGSDEPAADVGDAADAAEGRGVPVTAVGDTTAESDEDAVDDQPQRRGLMIPASMGLRFQIPADLPTFTVRASWGVYNPFDSGEVSKGGAAIRHFRRTPVEKPVVVTVADLSPATTAEYPLQDDVVLRVDVMDDPDRDRRLIEVALCNDRETPSRIPVNAWLFQTKLYVETDGEAAFLPVTDVLADTRFERDDELRRLNLQYRDRLEFAHGRTCSADWSEQPGTRRASRVWTTWLPVSETPQTLATEIDGALLDMRRLAEASPAEVDAGLRPIITGYREWLDTQDGLAAALPAHLKDDAHDALHDARRVCTQLESGLTHLLADPEALRCFRFMNRVMADQRIQSQVAEERAALPTLGRDAARERVLAKGPRAHSWRTFQLAFILMQLESLSRPELDRRSGDDLGKVELLFFPTGGGKTEAYLGLAAFTFAVRRRQGIVTGVDGPVDGRAGVAVLMRYTLRLLTAQQFQRATTLVCAAELARREDEATWGTEPFRIGLWVGTDVSPKRYPEAAEQLANVNDGRRHRLTVLQLQRCPWCGTRIEARDVLGDDAHRRVHVYCGDEFAECPFARGGVVDDGLPVLTVDEEIYRLAPAFVIATVDKFARLAREGEAASLFGYVRQRCERHGYVHADYEPCSLKDGSKHPAKDGLPAAAVHAVSRLRPPDLIIQDELHLITGALGTTVGLFEVAIDVLTSWTTAGGKRVKPLIVASTATVRNANDQIRGLYGRGVTVFPPQVLDVKDTYFSTEVAVSEQQPGRRYIGISTTGVRLTSAEIRVSEVLMSAAQLLMDRSGASADPYMTLVGYFNATRELAGMARYMADDIQTALSKGRPWTGLPRRRGTDYGSLNIAELTSRVASADITRTLDEMGRQFTPDHDSTEGKRVRMEQRAAGQHVEARTANPFDVVLATSMLQVGVDVTRLGLMLMVGQPKNTAEYIQASSRVGRDAARPGLVVTLGNWARPRDLAHFEQFRHYHETFYAQVEALSVTPFSVTSIERGLDGVLVSAARVLDAVRADGLSAERGAGRIQGEYDQVKELVDALVARATLSSPTTTQTTRQRLLNRLDQWVNRRKALSQQQLTLVYERQAGDGKHEALLISPDNARAVAGATSGPPFVVANSMREVQPEINLLVSPIKERLYAVEPDDAPGWELDETNGAVND
ncbi:DISARM system helicase DrmA [Aquipuribacter nitratireducens]|uniref:DISARM system helicase DrmA n=1 Tax=Aquipuribacter nitratireducens TaxID=650104 RepID=A0ABW0GIL8_9MICO